MRLLIVGTLEGHITAAGRIALSRGAKVAHVDDIDQAMIALRAGQGADLLMVDVAQDVGQLIASLTAERFSVPVVACGVGNDAGAAVRAIKAGAKEYLPLPPDAELIAAVLEAVSQESNAILFQDPAMQSTIKLVEQVAPSEASVLLTGESGTGKELLARHIHRKSRRARNKFVSVNCAAIPENLLESELFGHEKGAFTGAVARRIGKFEEANGGTLLLDEISEMDLRLQAKLLRAIQEREIDRVGGTAPVKIDIRIIATSNRNLEDEVRRGRFREDLFFRLNVVNVRVPPLRDRPKDIELLAAHFAKKYTAVNGLGARPLGAAAMAKLKSHGWRGNVRELENTMHRAVLMATGGEIDPEAIVLNDQPLGEGQRTESQRPTASSTLPGSTGEAAAAAARSGDLVGMTVAEVERRLILDTLQHCLGNRTHAANILGISIRTLRNKLKQYNAETGEGAPGEQAEASAS
ncbi:MAG: sigma-54-dependent Fis family transcriptional regulator [Alphaproteobacteria bacterium]|nr:sigma-54-dependent Fis family transcriptional regulator [Alphaproteobacteria bacterium]